jgi:hypothetical protein
MKNNARRNFCLDNRRQFIDIWKPPGTLALNDLVAARQQKLVLNRWFLLVGQPFNRAVDVIEDVGL